MRSWIVRGSFWVPASALDGLLSQLLPLIIFCLVHLLHTCCKSQKNHYHFGGLFLFVRDRILLCSPYWPGIHHVDYASLDLTEVWQPLPYKWHRIWHNYRFFFCYKHTQHPPPNQPTAKTNKYLNQPTKQTSHHWFSCFCWQHSYSQKVFNCVCMYVVCIHLFTGTMDSLSSLTKSMEPLTKH